MKNVFVALVLFLTSSYSFSFSPSDFDFSNLPLKYSENFNIEEGSILIFESNLSRQINLEKVFFHSLIPNPFPCRTKENNIGKEYLRKSILIYPSRGISEIIFPFHSYF